MGELIVSILLLIQEYWGEMLIGACSVVGIILAKPKSAEQVRAAKEKTLKKLKGQASKLNDKLEVKVKQMQTIEKEIEKKE